VANYRNRDAGNGRFLSDQQANKKPANQWVKEKIQPAKPAKKK